MGDHALCCGTGGERISRHNANALRDAFFDTAMSHLAPGRADYVKAFEGLNVNTEKISGTLFEISGTLAKTLATLKSSGTHIGVQCSLVTNLVTNSVTNLVTNLVITKQGDKFVTKFVTKFGVHQIW